MSTPQIEGAQGAPAPQIPNLSFDLAAAYVQALTGEPVETAVLDLRACHDTEPSKHAQPKRGTLSNLWPWIESMNRAGYGIFNLVQRSDGTGRTRDHIAAARAAWVDLDGPDAQAQSEAAASFEPPPSFAVQTSAGKAHLYWKLTPDAPLDVVDSVNARLVTRFNGDPQASDRARILRLPGSLHMKRPDAPTLVTCHRLAGFDQPVPIGALDTALTGVVPAGGSGASGRHPLGDPALAAPSLDLLQHTLDLTDPSELNREGWVSLSAAVKQAGWSLTGEAVLRAMWDSWCEKYEATGEGGAALRNDPAENDKLWRSIRDTDAGWPLILNRTPSLRAAQSFGIVPPNVARPASAMPVAANDETPARRPITATPYSWRDPLTIPARPWLLGRWVLMGEVTTILAPGGTGKSTLGAGIGLSLATGRALLGQRVYDGPHAVWLLNLEDGIEELERQLGAATLKHGIGRDDCGDRLFLDSGIVQPLNTATETRDGFTIDEATFDHLATTIRQRQIRVVVVDPFISSHTVSEASNEAIDAIVKRWKRLAEETSCAVVLVHHTKKLGGREATVEDGRGAVAMIWASRVALALNPMSKQDGEKLGVSDPTARRSIVRVDMGKANRGPAERATWFRIEGQCLGNATPARPADNVGVAVEWKRPDLLHGFTTDHLRALQERLGVGALRENAQATEWVGKALAEIAELDVENEEHKARIKAVLAAWIHDGSLTIDHRDNGKGSKSPFVVCGRSVDAMPGQPPPR